MKRVLLILSASRMAPACIEDAIRAASSEKAELVALFVLDTAEPESVQQRMAEVGFLGDVPSGVFLRAMRREQKRRADAELARICREAEQRGVACRTELVEGDFLTRSLEAAQNETATVIFVARRDRTALSRLVTGSAAEELKQAAPCRVLIHDACRS